jgi:DNA-binding ferritin-like protein
MTIEELFGTLQQSTVATWRKHLRTAKYGKHEALDEFYKEMPEKVDALIEAWMGANGKKVKGYDNLLHASNMNTLKYLGELKKVCKNGYELMGDNDELKGLLDDIVNLINSTLYKVKELSESTLVSLSDYINEALNDSIDADLLQTYFYRSIDDLYENGNINIDNYNDINFNDIVEATIDVVPERYSNILKDYPNSNKNLIESSIIAAFDQLNHR